MIDDWLLFKNNQSTLFPCLAFIPKTVLPKTAIPSSGAGFYCVLSKEHIKKRVFLSQVR